MRCVVVGATGYVGSRLVPELLAAGHIVRAAARTPAKLAEAPWYDRVELATVDVTDAGRIAAAASGQDVLYYLVHSLHHRDFVERDRAAARAVADAAREAGVRRVVYLGGISTAGQRVSDHLASRAEVGEILLGSGVPTVVLRAAVIIGSGSTSFEMLRYLTERLPVMVTPRWVHTLVQPIAIRDVLHYLTRTADQVPSEVNRGFDIGGPDVLTYGEMMRRYAAIADLPRRVVLPVPLLTPWLSAQWVNLVTPVPRSIAVPLVSSLIHEVRCHDHDIAAYVDDPEGGLTGYDHAVALALVRTREGANLPHSGPAAPELTSSSSWTEGLAAVPAVGPAAEPAAGARPPSDPLPTDPAWSGGTVYQDVRELTTTADTERLWQAIEAMAGEGNGPRPLPVAWPVPARIDRFVGNLRARGRPRVRSRPRVRGCSGGRPDGWQVEDVERSRRVRLRARRRLPGHAWLELSAAAAAAAGRGSVYRQRVIFVPRGLVGHLCWKCLVPFRDLVLGRLARDIVKLAEHPATKEQPAMADHLPADERPLAAGWRVSAVHPASTEHRAPAGRPAGRPW